MKRSFFLKYGNYRVGLRFEISGDEYPVFSFTHCASVEADDEVFKGWEGLKAFEHRLVQLYGSVEGREWLLRVVQHLLNVAEKEKVANPQRRARRAKKKKDAAKVAT